MSCSIKETDTIIKKHIKAYTKDGNASTFVDAIFHDISECASHPLLDVIEFSVHSLNANISRVVAGRHDKNEKVASNIKCYISQTASDLTEQIVSYYKFKPFPTLRVEVENILFDLCYSTIKEVFCHKEQKPSENFAFQFRLYSASNLAESFHLSTKFSNHNLDEIFKKSIHVLTCIETTTTLFKTRKVISAIQDIVIEDMAKCMDKAAVLAFYLILIDRTSEEYVNIFMFLIVKAQVIDLFGILAMVEGFKVDSDESSRFGVTFCNLCVAAKNVNSIRT
ncbi:hypothetical protein EIN_095170 [Entamoeba invadens IP1]|uniref:VPS9 domain-containing protein n=1 Tax=Entamoeba invadens IP1 TaxID=370355 RepID=A0A0A1U062_ENTIV|nr:hypothetical protein EIN_095170 [Entamoeba invadens IP1]ELP87280.1 hypothetical protein EIN_095170 [Entamoeba invadens IP1]|eukprot:XP_004254051.1 hypothetical protein EIN_095170 [Entamoeba invadens IP1]